MKAAWFLLIFLSSTLGEEINTSSQCQDHQLSLLLQMKNTLVFNLTEAIYLSHWNQTPDCCTWYGVECNVDGLVIGLDLSFEAISGGIETSTALFNLQHLERLNLAFTRFNGSQIPSSFGKLTNLLYLNLSNAGFTGQIPAEISSLRKLVVLDLSGDYYQPLKSPLKLEHPNLKMLVQNLRELRQLHLNGVDISSQRSEWCQVLSFYLYKLQVLSLSSCSLSGPIHQSLVALHSLSEIYLDGNNLSSPIPGFMANFTNLKILSFKRASLYGNYPMELLKMPWLETLDLSRNKLLGGSLPDFPSNMSLQILALAYTNFSGVLPTSLGNLKNLSKILLRGCEFGGQIPNSIAKLTQLVQLDLSDNMFTGSIPSMWMSSKLNFLMLSDNRLKGNISKIDWKQLESLNFLMLSGNRLEGNISKIDWKQLQSLILLDLESNSLTGEIPSSLFRLPLMAIYLSNNQFEGQLPDLSNGSTSVLETIYLTGNRLDGSIMSIFQLKSLCSIYLSYNKFNGTIPVESFGRFENLIALDLSYNKLTINANSREIVFHSQLNTLKLADCRLGLLPNLQNQYSLSDLDLSNNQIHGEIPNWIWNVGGGGLLGLNLSHNFLNSMQEPYKLPNLEFLDLSFNQIQGNIPLLPEYVDIDIDIPSYRFFSLSNNSFIGEIPSSICNAKSLEVLDLSYNNLSGRVPKCLMEKGKTLAVLNLRGNNLNGTMSDTFSTDCGLQTLQLNDNQLEGAIPKSLSNCRLLEVLDLGNNRIHDTFPCWLRKVSSLRILILRSNDLHGSIHCSMTPDSWPNLQILDLAVNNFSGNLSIKSLSNWNAMMVDEDTRVSDRLHYQLTYYYDDAITITSKGHEMKLVRILTVFTFIDLSCNRFKGFIPEEIGDFKSLHGLNLSHNALSGVIPPAIGNMKQLESLDLSRNRLSGTIPSQLANLNFLSVLNLSYNHFAGRIPTGTQIQSFPNTSFEGNGGLCGPPLIDCMNTTQQVLGDKVDHGNSEVGWQLALFVGIGFGTGFVAAVVPMVFFDRVDLWYDMFVHKLLGHFGR